MEEKNFESTNINQKWLENIYENIKNLEQAQRYAREGCASLIEYVQAPYENKEIILADLQYKNLKIMTDEIVLLLKDLTPILDATKLDSFNRKIKEVDKTLRNDNKKYLFIETRTSVVKNAVISARTTDFFWETMDFLHNLQIEIIKSISHILFVEGDKKKETLNSVQRW